MDCNDLISDMTIESIYKDGNLITSNEVNTRCINNDNKYASISIYNNDESMLLIPIERSYFRNHTLFSSEGNASGKVVKHEYFLLKDGYKGKKVASKIHPKEIEAYKQNNFKEIQLTAVSDGLVVWKKMFFKFQSPLEESKIKISIQKYLKEVKGMDKAQISKAIGKNPFSINPKLLVDEDNAENNFSEWILKLPFIAMMKMYKEVA